MTRRVSNEPIVWIPFAVGGMIAAMLVPIHLIVFGIAIPLGLLSGPGQAELLELVQLPIARLYLFVLVGGCLFHWAHRFRYVLVDLGVSGFRTPIASACYGTAIAATIWGGVVFFGA
jgi:fumarate reductase subunit D